MSDCVWLSDRMPAVAQGHAQWTKQEVQHLTLCGACQLEWKLVRAANRLGTAATERLEPAAIASSVLGRVERDRKLERRRNRTWTFGGLAAAAAVLVAMWTGALPKPGGSTIPEVSVVAGQLEIPLPELENLQPAELDSVLQTMDEPAARSANGEDLELGDLNSEELERVLNSWEG
jgi:hypothetical protein